MGVARSRIARVSHVAFMLAAVSPLASTVALAADTNAAPVKVEGRSAFGRVMDIMIASLVQQHEGVQPPQGRAAGTGKSLQSHANALPPPPRRKAKSAPSIDISLGAFEQLLLETWPDAPGVAERGARA